MKPQVEVSRTSAVAGVEAAISAWVANERNRVFDQELSAEEEVARADLARAAKDRELDAWESFGVS